MKYKLLILLIFVIGCDRPSSFIKTPVNPKIGNIPEITRFQNLTISGIKDADTDIRLNDKEVIPVNSSTQWTYDISLIVGENIFDFTSMNDDFTESEHVIMKIILDQTPPGPPTLNSLPAQTGTSLLTISGTKDEGSSILLNNHLIVKNDSKTDWSFHFTLNNGINLLSLTSMDISGNESAAVPISLELIQSVIDPPLLISPPNDLMTKVIPSVFKWVSNSSADKFIFQISRSINFDSLIINPPPETTLLSYSPAISLASGVYYWRVGAVGSNGNIAFSQAKRFIIGMAINDLNGDGFADVVVGSPFRDSGGDDTGEVYIYYGGALLNTEPDLIIRGESPGDGFGYTVSIVGDLNGDGYQDLAVSAPFNDARGADTGRVYIYYGGNPMDGIPDNILSGEIAGDQFGLAISPSGDINNDGFSDLIIGAPMSSNQNGKHSGSAYFYLGGISLSQIPDLILRGAAPEDGFAFAISFIGDINNDGYSDLAIGAPFNDINGLESGKVYIYLGGDNLHEAADIILIGQRAGDQLGFSVSPAGDFNGDGFTDFIISAIRHDADSVKENSGLTYLYLGSKSVNSEADLIFAGELAFDFFGYKVGPIGDLNNDGFDDIVISSPYNDSAGYNVGRVYIYYGGETIDNDADIILTGESDADLFGYSFSRAGDINNDGKEDLVFGTPFSNSGGQDQGRVYIYFNGFTTGDPANIILNGKDAFDEFGLSVY